MATMDDLDRQLGYLGKESPGIVRRAVLAGAKAMVPFIKTAANSQIGRTLKGKSISVGNMVRSIGARNAKQNGTIIGAKAGPDVGSMGKGADIDTHHGGGGHLFILGTDHRYVGTKQQRRRGQYSHTRILRGKAAIGYRGRAPAHQPSFVTEGGQASESTVTSVIVSSLEAGIAKAMERLG